MAAGKSKLYSCPKQVILPFLLWGGFLDRVFIIFLISVSFPLMAVPQLGQHRTWVNPSHRSTNTNFELVEAFGIYGCRACTESTKYPGRCEIPRCPRSTTQILRVKYCKFYIDNLQAYWGAEEKECYWDRSDERDHHLTTLWRLQKERITLTTIFFFSGFHKGTISTELIWYKKTLMPPLWKNSNNFTINK